MNDFFGKMSTVATQTSPGVQTICKLKQQKVQISFLHPHWKQKNEMFVGESNTDSVSSLKNISSINSSTRKSIGLSTSITTLNGKLVRSTSTPVSGGFTIEKPQGKGLNTTEGHVSSIHNNFNQSYNSPSLYNNFG